jgi:hypothetical protein
LTAAEAESLETLYRTTRDVRLRTRAQIVLLAGEQRLTAPASVRIVREADQTVRTWTKITAAYREQLLAAVRQRPRALGRPYSLWTLQRLADYLAELTGIRLTYETVRAALKAGGLVLSRPRHTVSSPDPEYRVKKRRSSTRAHLPAGDAFSYADEFNLSWLPTLRALWSPKGQQVLFPTPGQPDRYYGIGAVNYHTGETVVHFERRKEIAALLEALLAKHPTGTVYVALDNAGTHEDDAVEAVVRADAGRLVLLYLPTYSPWRNPIELLWRHFRREVTHCECFPTKQALLAAARDFFARHN